MTDWYNTITTASERKKEYERRQRVYESAPYTDDEIGRWNLFRAVDENRCVVATTRRVDPLIRFVCDVDARAIASNGVVVRGPVDSQDPSEAADVEAARLAWEASSGDRHLLAWASAYAIRGDAVWEVQQHDGGARLAAHHPGNVTVWRDPNGDRIIQAAIEFDYVAPPSQEALLRGENTDRRVTYRRVLTPDVIVTKDGDGVPVVVDNPLGVVPIVTARFSPSPSTNIIGQWAGSGLEGAVAMLDSSSCQIQTVGSRHANPLLLLKGFRLPDDSDPSAPSNIIQGVPPDSDVQWIEAALEGVRTLVESRASLREQVERLIPELLFVDAGASASGTALSYRASAFVAKIEPSRQAFYDALADGLAMAVAWDSASPASEVRRLLLSRNIIVDGGTVIPADRGAVVGVVTDLVAAGLITRTTATQMLQGASVVDAGVDPEVYAADAQRDADATAARAAAAAGALADQMALIQAAQGGAA